MNKKGLKTTIVAILVALLGITTFIMWYLGKVDNEGLTIGLAGISVLGTAIIGFLSKDADQSHSINGKIDHVGTRPTKPPKK